LPKFVIKFDLDSIASILDLPPDMVVEDIRVAGIEDGTKQLEIKLSKVSGRRVSQDTVYVPDFPIHQLPCGHWEICWASLDMIKVVENIKKVEDWEDSSSRVGRNRE
jgi:hypothetical protein